MVSGHLQEKNGMFHMVINFKDVNGKRRTKWFSTGLHIRGNKRKAEQMLAELRQTYMPDTLPNARENPPFTDYMREWLTIVKPNLEATTYSSYQGYVERLNKYFEAYKIPLKDLTANDIQRFYTYQFNEIKVSSNTVIHYHAVIRKALQHAVKLGLIAANPALNVDKPKIRKFTGCFYDLGEINGLLAAVKGMKIEMGIMFAAFYGLRRSEIIGLKWNAIDFTAKTITIRHTVNVATVDGKSTLISKDRAKNKSSLRSLPLVANFEDYLRKRKEKEDEFKSICGNGYHYEYDGYIYVDETGCLVSPYFLTNNLKTVLSKNNMRRIRFHDLRHSCASLLLANGVTLKEIQDWLGHSDFSTTANIYAHLDKSSKERSAAVLAGAGINIGL